MVHYFGGILKELNGFSILLQVSEIVYFNRA